MVGTPASIIRQELAFAITNTSASFITNGLGKLSRQFQPWTIRRLKRMPNNCALSWENKKVGGIPNQIHPLFPPFNVVVN